MFVSVCDVSEGHVLKLVNVSLDTSGEYRCVVTTPDLAGLRTEGSLQVLVQGESSSPLLSCLLSVPFCLFPPFIICIFRLFFLHLESSPLISAACPRVTPVVRLWPWQLAR